MEPKAKKIELYLFNGTLNGMTYVSESDGWDLGGILYSCPRDSVDVLLNDDSCDKYGVYLLISSKKVYIGQSTDLKHRIKQHKLQKDWWEKVILLTSKNDELDQSYITYLESSLITKANECGTLDCDNKTEGNKTNLNKFNKKMLDQYIEESLFILQLIGVSVFSKGKDVSAPLIKTTQNSNPKQIDLRAKREGADFLTAQGVKLLKNLSYAKLQETKNTFWVNPRVGMLEKDWDLILNNQISRTIYLLRIPSNTFRSSLNEEGTLLVRKDKAYYVDLNIDSNSFIDKRSKISFYPFIINSFTY